MDSTSCRSSQHLVWKRTTVQGRTALYGVAGQGVPVVFLHGWALGQHSYKRALKRLVRIGARVYAPALPGFGGTPDLPDWQFSIPGYAAWVDEFLSAVKVEEPVFLIGHSFGGGVAIQTAHDYPERVRYLVLINSIGGSAWSSAGSVVKSLAERPLWDWGLHFREDILPFRQVTRILPVILEDALPNLLRNPRAVWKVAQLARRADLAPELEELKRRQLPVVVLWGESDRVIPRASFDALCEAVGLEGEVVSGNHSWLLADPDAFGEVMTNVVSVANLAQSMESRTEKASKRRGEKRDRAREGRRDGSTAPEQQHPAPSPKPREARDEGAPKAPTIPRRTARRRGSATGQPAYAYRRVVGSSGPLERRRAGRRRAGRTHATAAFRRQTPWRTHALGGDD